MEEGEKKRELSRNQRIHLQLKPSATERSKMNRRNKTKNKTKNKTRNKTTKHAGKEQDEEQNSEQNRQ